MKSTSSGEGRSGLDYLAEYIWQVLLDFLVGKAQDMYATLPQKFRALRITGGLLGIEVNAAIHLNGKLTLNTEKVKNELPVGMLSPELKARQLPVTQSRPKPHFRRSLFLTQTPCSSSHGSRRLAAYRWRHAVAPSPLSCPALFAG